MFGIGGIYTKKKELITEQPLKRMRDSLRHRGPDDEGLAIIAEAGVGLIHTRLSIIDLTKAGHQPMWNDDKTVAIIFNGEIYNFPELRQELEKEGIKFRSRSDTEVILRGYEVWGQAVLPRLNGMFAFAIWDSRENWLWLARDRMGKKPLYYWFDPQSKTLLFASEIKGLLVWPMVKRQINKAGFNLYLTFGYIPAPETIFADVKKLPAAHWLLFDGDNLEISRYWSPPALATWQTTQKEYQKAIKEQVEKAIERRLISDVPLGVFLSGGIDSSIVTGVMSRLRSEPIQTFSAAYEVGPRSFKYNQDADLAEVTARKFNTNHTRLTIRPESNLSGYLEKVIWQMDEPHANPTLVSTYLLAELVKQQGITVALTGDGSDEIFGGYPRYLADRYLSLIRKIPLPLRRLLLNPRLLAKSKVAPQTPAWYLDWWQQFGKEHQERFLTPGWRPSQCKEVRLPYIAEEKVEEILTLVRGGSDQDVLALLDLLLWIPEESNMRLDKMTMAHGLEARSPFLDYQLVELALTIPFSRKVQWRPGIKQGKTLLRQTFADLLPPEIIKSAKRGWFSPRYYWLKDLLMPEVEKTLRWLPETGIFTTAVSSAGVGYEKDAALQQRLWSLLIFGVWYKKFLT